MGELIFTVLLLAVAFLVGGLNNEESMTVELIKQCTETNQIIVGTTVLSCKPTHTIINGKQIPLNQEGK